MSDGKIHIPARRKQPVDDQMVVKVTPEAYNALVEIYNESTLSLKQIASLLIVMDLKRSGEITSASSLRTNWSAEYLEYRWIFTMEENLKSVS